MNGKNQKSLKTKMTMSFSVNSIQIRRSNYGLPLSMVENLFDYKDDFNSDSTAKFIYKKKGSLASVHSYFTHVTDQSKSAFIINMNWMFCLPTNSSRPKIQKKKIRLARHIVNEMLGYRNW
ncbi:hypothetical protein RF11_14913 [Thelohanellus kitauei]|uniref:Uncharacterized protein n=1 Tax=Thelohanellus kitauei TaxID=669202 RepID=A0A0C2N8Z5_THEKT|nr:hypothetical protein RF11_14913 [Thelohanellus kitauei]